MCGGKAIWSSFIIQQILFMNPTGDLPLWSLCSWVDVYEWGSRDRLGLWSFYLWPKYVFLSRHLKAAFLANSSMCVSQLEHSVLTLQGTGDICPKFLSAQGTWVKRACVRSRGLRAVDLTLVDGLCPSDSCSGVLWRRAGPDPLEREPRVHSRSWVPTWGVSHSLTHTWQSAQC